ncbi:hypothetical protein G9444_6418 [Rhodococcus erythropolis]|uniref:DUF3987 domain-containing protein n=1 Tax=Rhodococcus erythropolis TaxID=1833 RepID=A0A6G9D497_RHOER|nr:hypothetical protein [Rhodococcus erythropolis]QIP43661.1 hypothetical protein G9444_6418 [Rhodococcus erythropolis]
MSTAEFFDATPELQTIRQWARARYAAEWAVFGGVLLRVAATTGPEVQLPGVIGGRASLNLLCAFVAPSGGGKGISDKVARLAWPAPIVERPIGSGEGIAATFVPPKKEGIEPITKAIINVPEIDTLAGIASRQGSILLAQLKSAAMGEQLGQANSSEATTRIVPAHTYRLCMSVGAQPAHTGVLFNDTTGGTPQRFLWFLTTDPDMPADITPDPEPLNARLPFWRPEADGVIEIVYGPPEITEMIIGAHIARQRGQEDALDGHAMLTRLKVAACLAILHHRGVVSELDWQLSGVVMEVSNRTRDWVVAESKKADRRKIRDRAISRAVGEEAVDLRRLTTVRKRIISVLADGDLAGGKLRAALGRREYRELFDQAVMSLENEGQIVADSSGPGTRYALFQGLNTEHSVQPTYPLVRGDEQGMNIEQWASIAHAAPESTGRTEVQGLKPQVGDGVPPVQGVPLAALLYTVPDGHPGPSRTCREWFERHVRGLIENGHTTVDSDSVYTAGQDAGWNLQNLRKVASKSTLVGTAEKRADGTALWNIGEEATDTWISAPQWLLDFLRAHGGWVRASDVHAAAQADPNGPERTSLKSAARAAYVQKRGNSIATEWCLDPSHEQESA